MKRMLVASAVIALMAGSVSAQEYTNWSGLYAGFGVGSTNYEFEAPNYSEDSSGSDFSIFFGYNYEVATNVVVGAEANYTFTSYENADINALSARAKAGYRFGNVLPYALVGIAGVDVSLDSGLELGNQFGSNDASDTMLQMGAGIEWRPAQRYSVGLEYVYANQDGFDGSSVDVTSNQLSLRAAYNF